ncbi:MAG TPA: adenylate/guanylate cyclase domain-containing protein [Gemmatimonadaceae bacterium]|nr:adenylate/guanylate cyclase domain-containing protein [Gemmatimonadaceae bacterium]
MTRFSPDRFPPGFFDLPQGAGETLPLEIIARWRRSDQTRQAALEILGPHTLRGTLVASDSAGLTRLTRERPLIEILAMLSHPKEIIHAFGRAIGGRGVGVWAADNTEMFYDATISAERVLGMLRAAMARMARECEAGIGMAVHTGEFYELGAGVYGRDADRIELVAEEHTTAGELVITGEVARALGAAHPFSLSARADLAGEFGEILRVTDGPELTGLEATDTQYPAPFPQDFSTGLGKYARTRRDSVMPRQAYEDLAVVLIVREAEDRDVPEVAVLNDLALTAAMKRIGTELLRDVHGAEIKNSGLLGIYTFPECRDALAFARAFRTALDAQGIRCRIGIDYGPVLRFELAPGSHDIAGSAVNIASKLAEDVGDFGKIQISDVVAQRAGARRERPTLTFKVSGVELRAYDL